MKLLLDTHVLLWWLEKPETLSTAARDAILVASSEVLISSVVVWEISIKSALGRLDTPENLREVVHDSGFKHLPVTFDHAMAVRDLPKHHRDPFDRMLAAQAIVENAVLVTRDLVLAKYVSNCLIA